MSEQSETDPTRRDFIYVATISTGAVGGAMLAWPFISQMAPNASVKALASIDVDIGSIEEGQSVSVMWRGMPVFIRHRTAKEIEEAKGVPLVDLKDPQTDSERVKPGKEQWLVMVGVCTHLGCIPLGEAGDFGGWFCPCHGSHYDTAGRIRVGPAPENLTIPPYEFLSDTQIKIG